MPRLRNDRAILQPLYENIECLRVQLLLYRFDLSQNTEIELVFGNALRIIPPSPPHLLLRLLTLSLPLPILKSYTFKKKLVDLGEKASESAV